jgi:hypothetical protein
VYESDHRRLWNEAIEKLEGNEHRIVAARTQIWGKADSQGETSAEDLISGSVEFQPIQNVTSTTSSDTDVFGEKKKSAETETIDFFSPGESRVQDSLFGGSEEKEDPSEDLIKF